MDHDIVVEGKVVLPETTFEGQVAIDGGMINTVKKQGLKGSRTIRVPGCLVFPGFIDPHAHLREPGWEEKEDFRTGTRAAVHGGVTTVFDMPNNPVPTVTREALEVKATLARQKAVVDVRFFGGVESESLEEVPMIAGQVIGYKLYLAETTGTLRLHEDGLSDALNTVSRTGRPVSLHCEDQSIIDRASRHYDPTGPGDAYADARPPESEIESVERVSATLARLRVKRSNVCHLSTGRSVDIVRDWRGEGRLACEATLHHSYFARKAMLKNRLLRTNPPLRSEEDRAAVVQGMKAGTVNFLVTDHAPHTIEEKLGEPFAGVPGLDDYGHIVSWLIRNQSVAPESISRLCSLNAASFFDLNDRGILEPGKRGDLTVLDMHAPEKVRSDRVASKCGWSPYEGSEFPGRIRYTLRGGIALLEDFELAV